MFLVGSEGCKPHFCSNFHLASQVAGNLSQRLGNYSEIRELNKENVYVWAPTWGQTHGTEIFYFDLGGLVLGCYESHWEYFQSEIAKLDSSRYDGKFFKLHGVHIMCLSLSQKNQLDHRIEAKQRGLS